MKSKKILTSKKTKDGYYHFYYKNMDVSGLWNELFASLSINQEAKCTEIFLKKYSKLLDELYLL